MWKKFCNWLLYKRMGWTKQVTIAHPQKFIICLAPHTSNWDFVLGRLYSSAEGMRVNFLMKKEWFVWPLGCLFRRMGGIPVYRSKHTSMTDNLARDARESESFRLCITPEGTRSANSDWKRGFLVIARKADLPILLYGIDYKRKLIQCTQVYHAGEDIEGDLVNIKEYYKGFEGKRPQNFAL